MYEVGLFRPYDVREPKDSIEAEMLTRFWDAKTILRSLSWLRLQNSLGRNVYIRPKGEHHLSLVDDLAWSSLERMKEGGFQPSVIVETSRGNFQAWLNHGRVLPKDLSTAAARALAESFGGDVKAAAWRQYGRLAGFTNRKQKHKTSDGLFPYVKLIEATGRVYDRADEFLSLTSARLEKSRTEAAARREQFSKSSGRAPRNLRSIEDFRANPLYADDGNRIDLAYAIYALSHGVPEDTVRRAIASRDLSKKGSELRQQQYIDRTIAKGLARAGLTR
jgi:hypothetical protein